MIQALLSRSDRRLAPVIAAVRGRHDQLGGWKATYREAAAGHQDAPPLSSGGSLPPPPPWQEVIHAGWSPDRVLPWVHLEGPLPPATLAAHRQQALAGETAAALTPA